MKKKIKLHINCPNYKMKMHIKFSNLFISNQMTENFVMRLHLSYKFSITASCLRLFSALKYVQKSINKIYDKCISCSLLKWPAASSSRIYKQLELALGAIQPSSCSTIKLKKDQNRS